MDVESKAIETAQELLQDSQIPDQLALIKANFQLLANSITALEERLPLQQSINIVEEVRTSLTLEPFAEKLDDVLKRNPGYAKMTNINKILSGREVAAEERAELPSGPATIASFSCAPITSVDVERFFSALKDLLSSKRLSMSEDHVRDQMLLQWNKDLFVDNA